MVVEHNLYLPFQLSIVATVNHPLGCAKTATKWLIKSKGLFLLYLRFITPTRCREPLHSHKRPNEQSRFKLRCLPDQMWPTLQQGYL